MAWMKRTDSCPLCKLHVGIIISDILHPSYYSQYLPNGKPLYSQFNPNRRAMFVFFCFFISSYILNLENHPHYEKEVLPNDVPQCLILKEWIRREIEVMQMICLEYIVYSSWCGVFIFRYYDYGGIVSIWKSRFQDSRTCSRSGWFIYNDFPSRT